MLGETARLNGYAQDKRSRPSYSGEVTIGTAGPKLSLLPGICCAKEKKHKGQERRQERRCHGSAAAVGAGIFLVELFDVKLCGRQNALLTFTRGALLILFIGRIATPFAQTLPKLRQPTFCAAPS